MTFSSKQSWWHIMAMSLVIAGLFSLVRFVNSYRNNIHPVQFGVTYSTMYASYLGLDVFKTYQELIEELGVRAIRLPVYWSDVEPQKDQFVWTDLDKYVAYAQAHHVKLTLAIGKKVPRWPECFVPNWAQRYSEDDQETALLNMVTTLVDRYRLSTAIDRWQIENEPFFPFGVCQQIREQDLQQQILTVRGMDARPIQVTASGEIGPWSALAKQGDVLGISLYRKTWNNVFGYFVYPLSPEYYSLRIALLKLFQKKQVVVSELQAEPWFSAPLSSQPIGYWYEAFTAEDFANNIEFVKRVDVSEAYLWGAEWWAYLKLHGEDRLWNEAKQIFQN